MWFRSNNKRRIPYQWRLFLPLVVVLWVILLSVAGWQVHRNNNYKEAFVAQQLKMVNSRIARAIKAYNWSGIELYKKFIQDFYSQDPIFDDIRMTIYDPYWEAIDTVGPKINIPPDERAHLDTTLFTHVSHYAIQSDIINARSYYLATPVVVHGDEYVIISSLPNTQALENFVVGDIRHIWLVIFVIALIFTVIAYIAVNHLARNINLLREFANRSADDPGFMPGEDFAHDELGDIARKIVQLYNQRTQAREQIEREHQMAIHTVEEKARQKRQMTIDINHELKTPIGVIKGYLDTITDSPDMDEATRTHFINKAREHANRLVNLVTDVSAITRLEEGENQINTEKLDYHELAYMFINDARESGILGHFSIDLNVPLGIYINGNGNLLVGMLMNLTKNAVNYSGGDRLSIDFRGEDDQFYHFAFRDNGHGVPDASIEHLFDRFYRIDSGRARKSGGSGLGLAIVYNTVKAHGGKISARNLPEGGLEFIFTLRKFHH